MSLNFAGAFTLEHEEQLFPRASASELVKAQAGVTDRALSVGRTPSFWLFQPSLEFAHRFFGVALRWINFPAHSLAGFERKKSRRLLPDMP
ncbi:hypothetical protein ACTL6U_14665 [Rhodovibrionaceae bacterium A322]